MRISYVIERFLSDTGHVEVLANPVDYPGLAQRFNVVLMRSDGTFPDTKEQVHAIVQAAIPVALFEQKIAQAASQQDVTHIAQEQGRRVECDRTPRDQGQLRIIPV